MSAHPPLWAQFPVSLVFTRICSHVYVAGLENAAQMAGLGGLNFEWST